MHACMFYMKVQWIILCVQCCALQALYFISRYKRDHLKTNTTGQCSALHAEQISCRLQSWVKNLYFYSCRSPGSHSSQNKEITSDRCRATQTTSHAIKQLILHLFTAIIPVPGPGSKLLHNNVPSLSFANTGMTLKTMQSPIRQSKPSAVYELDCGEFWHIPQ